MTGMACIHSREYHEDICYYTDDLYYSSCITGVGYDSGRAYVLCFTDDGRLESIDLEEID